MDFFRFIIIRVLDIYMILIILRAILSWFSPDPYNPLYQLLIRITEPVLGRIRKLVPTPGIDFSPFIAIILIQIISGFIR
ncbi:MAG TPA: YggT family protein [Candidatus Cloacimonetes bacterium]|nr:YggT family protein [Candidatus Cloacimonadota bacterium]